MSGRTKRFLSMVSRRSADISNILSRRLGTAVPVRILLKVLNYQVKLPGSAAPWVPGMDWLSKLNELDFEKDDPHSLAAHHSIEYNELRFLSFSLLNKLSEDDKQMHLNDIACKYTNKIYRSLRNLYRIKRDPERWSELFDIVRSAAELSFRIKLSRTQYRFYLPNFEDHDELKYRDDCMDSMSGFRCPENEGEIVGLVTCPALFKCRFGRNGIVSDFCAMQIG